MSELCPDQGAGLPGPAITPTDLELHAKWWRNEPGGVRLVRRRAVLRDANLRDANLRGADFQGADLQGAVLQGANLGGADLRDADLQGADLLGADLLGADLRDVDLRGTVLQGTVLQGADLQGAIGLPIAADAAERLRAVAAAALADDEALEMNKWHSCPTAHCVSGWAIHQAGELGRILEAMHGSEIAGLLLLGPDAHRHFYDSNEDARAYLQSVLEVQP